MIRTAHVEPEKSTVLHRLGPTKASGPVFAFSERNHLAEGYEMAEKKHDSGRELIDTGNDKRYVRRDENGRFEESDDVGWSLSQDVRKHA